MAVRCYLPWRHIKAGNVLQEVPQFMVGLEEWKCREELWQFLYETIRSCHINSMVDHLLSIMSPRPWENMRSFRRDTSSFSSRTNLLLGSSLITALQRICLARSAYLWICEHGHTCVRVENETHTHIQTLSQHPQSLFPGIIHTHVDPAVPYWTMLPPDTAPATFEGCFEVWNRCKSLQECYATLRTEWFECPSKSHSAAVWEIKKMQQNMWCLFSTWVCWGSHRSWYLLDSGQQPWQCVNFPLTQHREIDWNTLHSVSRSLGSISLSNWDKKVFIPKFSLSSHVKTESL